MLERGCVVISSAGRDRNTFLTVTAADEVWVWVCDGKARPLDNPKRKNPKHVLATDRRLQPEDLRSNKALRRALAIVKASFLREGANF